MCYLASNIHEFLISLLTPLIAVIATYIAYQQWQIRKEHFQLELFDKRYKVYLSTKEFISKIIKHGYPSEDEILKFVEATNDSVFLFDEKLQNRLNLYLNRGEDLYYLNIRIALTESSSNEAENKISADKESELQEWFQKEFKQLSALFYKYLKIKSKFIN